MPEITKEHEAFIEITAQRVADKLEEKLIKQMEKCIELHVAQCSAGKLGAFKAVVMTVLGGIAVLIGDWIQRKL